MFVKSATLTYEKSLGVKRVQEENTRSLWKWTCRSTLGGAEQQEWWKTSQTVTYLDRGLKDGDPGRERGGEVAPLVEVGLRV